MDRTNNKEEGWNRSINDKLEKAGPLIQKKILVLQDEQLSKQQYLFRYIIGLKYF